MQKTDNKLQRDVQDEFKWEPSLNAAHIGVAAEDGVITLTGHVDNYDDKRTAKRATKHILGVRAVANDLTVKLPGTSVRDDTDVAETAVLAIKWSVAIPESITVTVKNGVVTLKGNVDWNYQRNAVRLAHAC